MRALIFCLFALLPASAGAQDVGDDTQYLDGEIYAELLHSNLPLYSFDWEEFWPRSFSDGESFGCSSRVDFGDWQITDSSTATDEDVSWMRITNYGVFHCAAYFGEGYERAELENADPDIGYFVKLGEIQQAGGTRELWAIQRGVRPGSEYMLLAREPGGEIIDSFVILQQRCPENAIRELEDGMDVWMTRYCAINSRDDLLSLAEAMLNLPPIGQMTRVGDSDWIAPLEPEDQEPEPEPEDGSFLLETLTSTPQ